MAGNIPALRFTKDWTNPADFPAHEASEDRVRADMQLLHNEVKTFINEQVVPRVNGSQTKITCGTTPPVGGEDGDVYIQILED